MQTKWLTQNAYNISIVKMKTSRIVQGFPYVHVLLKPNFEGTI